MKAAMPIDALSRMIVAVSSLAAFGLPLLCLLVVRRPALLDIAVGLASGMALVAGMNSEVPPGTVRAPCTTDEYRANPKRWASITGLVTAGTRLRAEVLRGKGNLRDPKEAYTLFRGRLPTPDALLEKRGLA